MNNPFVMQQAEQIARRVNHDYPADQSARIDALFRIMLGRLPYATEKANAERFLELSQTETASEQIEAWTAFCQTMIACIDFRYIQ
jgi:hypothetical protein